MSSVQPWQRRVGCSPSGSSFFRLLNQTRQETKAQQLEATIEQRLRSSTITLGGNPAIDLVGLSIDWQQNPPLIRARVRVTDPTLPTATQVAAAREFINKSQAPLRFRLVMQRTAVDLIGPETASNPADLEVLPPPALPPLPRAPEAEDLNEKPWSNQNTPFFAVVFVTVGTSLNQRSAQRRLDAKHSVTQSQ